MNIIKQILSKELASVCQDIAWYKSTISSKESSLESSKKQLDDLLKKESNQLDANTAPNT